MKVFWTKKAQHAFHEQVVWYEANRGHDFVVTFAKNIESSVNSLSITPSIGTFIKESNGKTYRSFVNHPRCRIFYWYNKEEIHISNLRFAATR